MSAAAYAPLAHPAVKRRPKKVSWQMRRLTLEPEPVRPAGRARRPGPLRLLVAPVVALSAAAVSVSPSTSWPALDSRKSAWRTSG